MSAPSSILHHHQGFDAHKSPIQCPIGCRTWNFKQGQRVRWMGTAFQQPIQGTGLVVGCVTTQDLGVLTQWIVQLTPEDAAQLIPGGFHCKTFWSYELQPLSE